MGYYKQPYPPPQYPQQQYPQSQYLNQQYPQSQYPQQQYPPSQYPPPQQYYAPPYQQPPPPQYYQQYPPQQFPEQYAQPEEFKECPKCRAQMEKSCLKCPFCGTKQKKKIKLPIEISLKKPWTLIGIVMIIIIVICAVVVAFLPPKEVNNNKPPIAIANGPYIIGNTSGDGGVVNFSSEGSYDPDGDSIYCEWDFGDHSTSGLRNPQHTYAADGRYTVVLTVVDSHGARTTETTYVEIS